jgi:hypothetical protein
MNMRMNPKVALMASAGLAVAFLAACSDSPTAVQPRVQPMGPSLVVAGGTLTTNTPEVGKVKVCKIGNAGGSFDVSRTAVNGGTGTVSGDNTLIDTGTCKIVAEDDGPNGVGSNVVVTEDAAANTVSSVTSCVFIGGEPPVIDANPCAFNPANRFINHFHGYVVTYTNTFTPPPPPDDVCDFSTFGGFVLLPNNISYGGNAGFASSGFAYGDLNFKNHTNGDHIHVWNVTDYGHPDTGPLSQFEDSRLAFGKGEINGSGSFDVEFRFLDSGEPAKKAGDRVYLIVNGVVLIPEQEVDGGNIQLHAKCKKAPKAEKH